MFRSKWDAVMSIVVVILMSLLVQACVPAAFVVGATAGATAGGALIYDKRDTNTMLNDTNISKQVKYKIDHDPDLIPLLRIARIKINVFDRVVLLVGQVPNGMMRNRIYQLAMSVNNVKRVYNQLTVSVTLSMVQQSNDALITSEVKSFMLATQGLRSTQIRTITEDHVVYLMGVVTRKQAALAANAARKVQGVERVVEVFEYEE